MTVEIYNLYVFLFGLPRKKSSGMSVNVLILTITACLHGLLAIIHDELD